MLACAPVSSVSRAVPLGLPSMRADPDTDSAAPDRTSTKLELPGDGALIESPSSALSSVRSPPASIRSDLLPAVESSDSVSAR